MNDSLSIKQAPRATVKELVILWLFFLFQWVAVLTVLLCLVNILLRLLGLPLFLSVNVYWGALIWGYFLRLLGISLCNHRLLTHGAFKPHPTIRCLFFFLGAVAFQGLMAAWRRFHKEHHGNTDIPCTVEGRAKAHALGFQFVKRGADEEKVGCDPHTPLDGFWHSAFGHLFKPSTGELDPAWQSVEHRLQLARASLQDVRLPDEKRTDVERGIRNLEELLVNRTYALFFDRTIGWWVALGFILPGVICAAIQPDHSLWGLACGWFWGAFSGGLAAMGCVNIVTALVNSYEHVPGLPGNYTHYKIQNNAQNNWILMFINVEAFHFNHHVVEDSANQGIYWYERIFDHSATILAVLARLRLVKDVNWTSVEQFEKLKVAAAGG